MKRVLALAAILWASPAAGASLREKYDNCVGNNYVELIAQGRQITALTAENAVQSCETELQTLYSLLINTDMDPKLALSMVTNIRLAAKRRLHRS